MSRYQVTPNVIFNKSKNVKALDLDTNPLFVYKNAPLQANASQVVEDDSSESKKNTRRYSFSSLYNNVLLGTTNFYLDTISADYHNEHKLQTLLSQSTLPSMQYIECDLAFSGGYIADEDLVGHAFEVYVNAGSKKVVLASFIDYVNDSEIQPIPTIEFANALYNEAIKFRILDIPYIMTNPQMSIIKSYLFGDNQISDLVVNYAPIYQSTTDDFIQDSKSYSRLNFQQINTVSVPLYAENQELIASLKISDKKNYLTSLLSHTVYNTEQYLNTLKSDLETYNITHTFTTNSYDESNNLIETISVTMQDNQDTFSAIKYRPIVTDAADHFTTTVTISVENVQTGLIISKSNEIVISNLYVNNFKDEPLNTYNLVSDDVSLKVHKSITQITPNEITPKFIETTRYVYVQVSESSESVSIEPIDDYLQSFRLNVEPSKIDKEKLTLKIGKQEVIEDSREGNNIYFKINNLIYNEKATKYYILGSNKKLIQKGSLTY